MKTESTVVISGTNRGIGLELTRLYRDRGAQVVALCRRPSAELSELGVEIIEGVDVTDADSVARTAGVLEGRRIDILLHNAGVLNHTRLGSLDFDSIRTQFEVNAIGPLRLTEALTEHLGRGSKVAIVTSRMGSIADNGSGGAYGYRMSKAAVNAAGVSLARDLGDRGVSVCLLHPGYVRTEMTGGMGDVAPAHAAKGLMARIDELNIETSGGFWHANGQRLPW